MKIPSEHAICVVSMVYKLCHNTLWSYSGNTMVHHGTPWYTTVYHGNPWYTMVHGVHHGISWCDSVITHHSRNVVYHGVPWCTIVHHGVPWYTIIHCGVPRYDRVVTHCGRTMVPVCSGLPRFTTVLQSSISW